MKEKEVILVNENDEATGSMAKMLAHEQALLHRAFSVFIFDEEGRMLIHQRALEKYHGGGLWTNACCSHPAPGEKTHEAALKRLQEEMGFTVPLEEVFSFIYKADVGNGLTEFEYDHVFAGIYNGEVVPDAREVAAYAYVDMKTLARRLQNEPEQFTVWFKVAFERVQGWWKQFFGTQKNLV